MVVGALLVGVCAIRVFLVEVLLFFHFCHYKRLGIENMVFTGQSAGMKSENRLLYSALLMNSSRPRL